MNVTITRTSSSGTPCCHLVSLNDGFVASISKSVRDARWLLDIEGIQSYHASRNEAFARLMVTINAMSSGAVPQVEKLIKLADDADDRFMKESA